jgi:O-antigen/teichoic acid export membrane protein
LAFGIRVSGMALLFGLNLAVANSMDDASYGMYAYALALAPTMAILGEMGMPQAALRFIAEYSVQNLPVRSREFLRYASRTTLLASFGLLATGWGTYYLWRGWFEPEVSVSAWYGFAFVPAIAIVHLYQESLRSYKRIVLSQVFEQLFIPVILLATAGYALWRNVEVSLAMLLGLHLALYGVVAVALAYVTRLISNVDRTTPVNQSGYLDPTPIDDPQLPTSQSSTSQSPTSQSPTSQSPNPSASAVRQQWRSVAMPLGVSAITGVLLTRCDILLIGAMTTTTHVAHYSAAARLAMILTLGLAALNAIATPYFVEAYHCGQMGQLQKLVSNVTWTALAVTALPAICIICGGRSLLALFGPNYVVAFPALLCLAFAQIINVSCGPVGPLMMTTGGHRVYAYTLTCTCLVSLIATPIAIRNAGLTGAAVVNLATTILWNITLAVQVQRRLGVATYPRFFVGARG